MGFHWSLSDCMSRYVSRTLLSILVVLNNAVLWMVSTHLLTCKSSTPLNSHLVTEPKAPITISTIVTYMFHSFFFNSLARSRYLSFFSYFFNFILWSAGTANSEYTIYSYYRISVSCTFHSGSPCSPSHV